MVSSLLPPGPDRTATVPVTGDPPIRRVVVAKPMKLYGEVLAAVCQQVFPEATVEVCQRGLDVLATLRAEPADILVIGLAFPDIDGLDLLEPVARGKLAARVLIDTPRLDEYSLLVLRTARFDGFINAMSEGLDAMSRALRAVAEGQGYISADVLPTLVERSRFAALVGRLSMAEIHVLSVIGDGSDNDEGAQRLGLSASTVQTHRRNIMRKLEISTSAKLVREAVRLGVVRITPRGVLQRGITGGFIAASGRAAPERKVAG